MVLPDLRNDLVDEILCRVPARNLKRLRSTCKRWNRLFKDDRRFAREHSHKAPKEYLALMLTNKYRIRPMSINLQGDVTSVVLKSELSLPDPDSNNSHQFDIDEVFHCDGLLVCSHDGNNRRYGFKIVVWNPFTGQTRWIKAGNRWKEPKSFVLGYCYQDKNKNKSCSKSYKVLCLSSCGKNTEIYELKSDTTWRRIPDGDLTPGWFFCPSHTVSLKGNTYFFATEKSKPHLGVSLLRFDFSTEKSSLFVPLPYQRPLSATLSLSAVRGEKLSVLIQPEFTSKTEIWVTSKIDDTTTKGAVSWTKVLALDLSPELQITDEVKFLLDEDKKVAVCCERWLDDEDETKTIDKIFILGEDNKVTEVGFGVDTNAGVWPVILNYVPSLVQIEQAGGNRIRSG
ncbi:F-box associated interaction domain [Arabidopsis suecica]|uniref:F-box associated interaction domain n=1 Tax=Arabidopsis suecica TaxID=45249 RepID=A0A8T2B8I4_ARASU|nr:F-box associated interaction domain [Arabidopsis suecica]